jgi:hypothetical protein
MRLWDRIVDAFDDALDWAPDPLLFDHVDSDVDWTSLRLDGSPQPGCAGGVNVG